MGVVNCEVPFLLQANFSMALPNKESLSFILFYAPWCKYSRDFLPQFDEVSEIIRKNSHLNNIFLAKVDCVQEKDIYWSENIADYGLFPILKTYIAGGSPLLYEGERNAESVLQYLTEFSRSAFTEIDESKLEKKITNQKSTPLVAYYRRDPSSYEISFNYACRKASNFVKCVVLNISPESNEKVVIYRNFSGEPPSFTAPSIDLLLGSYEISNKRREGPGDVLYNWVLSHSYPQFPPFTAATSEALFSSHRPGFRTHVLFLLNSNHTEFMDSVNSIRQNIAASSEFRGKCLMAYIDTADDSDYITSILDSLQFSPAILPAPSAVIIHSAKTKVSFYRTNNAEVEAAKDWLRLYFKGELKSFRVISQDE